MIVYQFGRFGDFIAGDTETGFTAYAYPTSSNAARAKKHAATVAAEMMARENAFRPTMVGVFPADGMAEVIERDARRLSAMAGV